MEMEDCTNSKELPYIEVHYEMVERKYNPEFGDDRICRCGHRYVDHFLVEEDYHAWGCCYCNCYTFVEKE